MPPVVGKRDLWEMSPTERERYAQDVYSYLRTNPSGSPVHDSVLESLMELWTLVRAEPLGARTVLGLSAPYSCGKSTVAKRFAAEIYQQIIGSSLDESQPVRVISDGVARDIEADWIPVVYLNLQSDTASKDLYAQVLAFLGHPVAGSRGILAARTTSAMRDHGVRLVVVDDAHMLRTRLQQGRATLDALKHLATEVGEIGGVLMLVGAFDSDSDLLHDAQLRGRLELLTFSPYKADTPAQRAVWQRLLRSREEQVRHFLTEMDEGELSRGLAGTVYAQTQGYVGDVSALLSTAVRAALKRGEVFLSHRAMQSGRVSQRALDAVGFQRLGSNVTGTRQS